MILCILLSIWIAGMTISCTDDKKKKLGNAIVALIITFAIGLMLAWPVHKYIMKPMISSLQRSEWITSYELTNIEGDLTTQTSGRFFLGIGYIQNRHLRTYSFYCPSEDGGKQPHHFSALDSNVKIYDNDSTRTTGRIEQRIEIYKPSNGWFARYITWACILGSDSDTVYTEKIRILVPPGTIKNGYTL